MDSVRLAELALLAVGALASWVATRIALRRWGEGVRKRAALSFVDHFRAAGGQLGLKLVRDSANQDPELRGRIDDCEVVVDGTSEATRVTVRPVVPVLIEFCVQTRWRPAMSTLCDTTLSGALDIETGDLAFDALFEVRGHVPTVRALLTSGMRSALTALARSGVVRVDSGGLAYEIIERLWCLETRTLGQPGHDRRQPLAATEAIVALVREVVAAAAWFPRVSNVRTALAEVAGSDPLPGVRRRCLATLIADAQEHPLTLAVIEAGLADSSDSVRVVAATAVGERGVPILREIATREDSEEEAAARAIAVLGRRLTGDQTLAILDSALDAGRRTVALSAIDSLGRVGDESAYRRLHSLLHGDDEPLAVAAADALGFVHSATAEEQLDRALLSPLPGVRHAAVRALARTGRLASISPLRALIEAGTAAPDLIAAAHHAIAAIQARLPDASPGQVSLAEGEAGHVSLTGDDRAGQVSLSTTERDAP